MSNEQIEIQMDKVSRLLREYIVNGHSDVALNGMLKNMVWKLAMVSEQDKDRLIEYGLNRLRGETVSPETISRGENKGSNILVEF